MYDSVAVVMLQTISLQQLRLYWHIWSTGISWPLEPLLSCLLKWTHFALFTWAGSVDGCRNSGNLLFNLLYMYFCLVPDRLHCVGGDHYPFFWGGYFNCMWECIPNLAVLSACRYCHAVSGVLRVGIFAIGRCPSAHGDPANHEPGLLLLGFHNLDFNVDGMYDVL